MSKDNDNFLVYSTDIGRIKQARQVEKNLPVKSDGYIYIQRQTSGRKGKGVSVISGLDLDQVTLNSLAAELKKKCGCGGSIKNGYIEIQGDKRELLKQLLEEKGFKVKLSGG